MGDVFSIKFLNWAIFTFSIVMNKMQDSFSHSRAKLLGWVPARGLCFRTYGFYTSYLGDPLDQVLPIALVVLCTLTPSVGTHPK